MFYIAIVLSILSGVTIVLSRMFNASLAKEIGLIQSTFFNFAVGWLFSVLFLIFSNEFTHLSFNTLVSAPIWAYFGGAVGVVVVSLSSYLSYKIPVFYLTLLLFIGQLFAGILIDFATLNQLSIGKVIGGIFIFIGLSYNLMQDYKKELDPSALISTEKL
ncbi:DMT family transporter [Alkaliphilus transvaalensis]|uniref:DMT family transporter n=1 Tax=Alkaliphilus transvaalensis TaxID=114628 RepID=UPI000551611D|nr:DMT family transporter [Alkaliphilus transvaalensis]